MTHSRWFKVLPVLLGVLLAVPVRAAEESPLAQVPAKAPIVISFHGVERIKKRVLAMVKTAVPDLGPDVQAAIDKRQKEMLDGRELKGLKEDGYGFLVLTSLPLVKSTEPKFALILRVADYKAFRDGILKEDERKTLKEDKKAGYEVVTINKETIYFVKRKDYAVMAQDKDVAVQMAKNETGKGLAGTLDKDLARKLLAADIGGYADMVAINKTYGLWIRLGHTAFNSLLDQAGQNGVEVGKKNIALVKDITNGVFQAVEDSTSVLMTVDFHPQGLAFKTRVGFAKDSKSNKFLKTLKASDLTDLSAMPSGLATYTAAEFSPAMHPTFRSLSQLITSVKQEDKDQAKAFQAALDDFLAAGPKSMVSASVLEVGRGGLQLWRYEHPDKGLAAMLKYFQALRQGATFQFLPVKGDPEIKMNAETYRGGKFHSVHLRWDMDKLNNAFPNVVGPGEVLRKVTGEGIHLWVGNVDKLTVQVWAKDWKTARHYLDQYYAKQKLVGAKRNKGYTRARANLAPEVTFVNLTDMSLVSKFYGDLLHAMLKELMKLPERPPAMKKSTPSYLGMALTLRAGEGRFDLWVPSAAAGDIRRLVEMLTPKEPEGE